jgi:hypothetical protein
MSLAARIAGFMPVGAHTQQDAWSYRYHASFGISEFLNLQRYRTPRRQTGSREIDGFVRGNPSVSDLLSLRIHGVDAGRIALSNVLSRRKFARFDISEPETLREIGQELRYIETNVIAAKMMIQAHRPVLALLLEKGLSPVAEIFGVCIASGVPVVQFVGSQNENDLVLKRYSDANRHQHPFSLDPCTWDKVQTMSWSAADEAALAREFEEAYTQGTWFNRKFLHQDKQIKPPDAVRRQLGLDPSKKTAVIFSHVLWDATFFYGVGLFENYEAWLLATVRAACRNPAVNWVLKLHPDLVWKLKYEGYTGELRDTIAIRSSVGELPDHVKLVMPDTDISSYSFFSITDYCVTVRGTIGIEMACHGVPVLTAGTGRYSGMGFTIDSASQEEYLDRLARIQEITAPPPSQTEMARRFAFALFKKRPWPMRSFRIVRKPIQEAGNALDQNLIPCVRSFEELAAADDMRQLAGWLESNETDFLRAQAAHV